jgi:putative transposase
MNMPDLISVADLAEIIGSPSQRTLKRCAKAGRYKESDCPTEWVEGENGGGQYRFVTHKLPPEWLAKVLHHFDKQSLPGAVDAPRHTQARAVAGLPDRTKPDLLDDPALAEALAKLELPEVDPVEVTNRYELASRKQQKASERKVDALSAVDRLVRAGVYKVDDCVRVVAADYGVDPNSIYNWKRAVRGYDRKLWLGLLMDNRGGNREKLSVSDGFLEVVWKFYREKRRPSFDLSLCRAKELAPLMKPPVEIPAVSNKTIQRRFYERYPHGTRTLYREGKKVWGEECHTSQTRDRSGLCALQMINGDGHELDYMVEFPDGTTGRVMATFWMDLSSNYFFEPYLARSENTDTIHRSFLQICEKYGVPQGVYIDNGMGYAGKAMSGGDRTRHRFKKVKDEADGAFRKLGVETKWALPGRGQSKPIERAFRTLEKHLAVALEDIEKAYTGNEPKKRPEGKQIPVPFDVLRRAVMRAVLEYNTHPGRKAKTIPVNGGSYYELWKKKYAEAKKLGLIEELEPWRMEVARRRGLMRKVHEKGGGKFTLPKIGEFSHPALNEFRGQMVEVRYDPANQHADAIVLGKDGKQICVAKLDVATGFNSSADGREAERLRRRRQKLDRERGEVQRNQDILDAVNVLKMTGEELHSMDEEAELQNLKFKKDAAAKKAAEEAELLQVGEWENIGLHKLMAARAARQPREVEEDDPVAMFFKD